MKMTIKRLRELIKEAIRMPDEDIAAWQDEDASNVRSFHNIDPDRPSIDAGSIFTNSEMTALNVVARLRSTKHHVHDPALLHWLAELSQAFSRSPGLKVYDVSVPRWENKDIVYKELMSVLDAFFYDSEDLAQRSVMTFQEREEDDKKRNFQRLLALPRENLTKNKLALKVVSSNKSFDAGRYGHS